MKGGGEFGCFVCLGFVLFAFLSMECNLRMHVVMAEFLYDIVRYDMVRYDT